MTLIALVREVPASLPACQLTHVRRAPIDVARAREQHAEYAVALAAAGCQVAWLPEAPDLPDSVFVEDTVVVLDEVAVLARPGAASRRPEVDAVGAALSAHRTLRRIDPPATLDGGDVLQLGHTLWVGISSRTTRAGAAALALAVAPFGYRVEPVVVDGALHLKSAVSRVGVDLLLANRRWVDPSAMRGYRVLDVDPGEPFAANAVCVDDAVVIHSTEYPRTQAVLRAAGLEVRGVDASELARAEGGVTCCSVIFRAR